MKRLTLAIFFIILFSFTVYGQELYFEELEDVISRFSGEIAVGEAVTIEDFTIVPLLRLRVFSGGSKPGTLVDWFAGGFELEPVAMVVIREGDFKIFSLNGTTLPTLFPLAEDEQVKDLSKEEQEDLFQEGVRKLEEGKIEEAKEIFEYLLQLRPENADTHAFLGRAYAKLAENVPEMEKKIQYGMDAFREFSKALEIDPDNPYALTARGYARLMVPPPLGGADLAIEDFTRALDGDPESIEAHLGMAHIYVSRGNYEKAREHYQMVIELDPDNQRAIKELQRLEEGDDQ